MSPWGWMSDAYLWRTRDDSEDREVDTFRALHNGSGALVFAEGPWWTEHPETRWRLRWPYLRHRPPSCSHYDSLMHGTLLHMRMCRRCVHNHTTPHSTRVHTHHQHVRHTDAHMSLRSAAECCPVRKDPLAGRAHNGDLQPEVVQAGRTRTVARKITQVAQALASSWCFAAGRLVAFCHTPSSSRRTTVGSGLCGRGVQALCQRPRTAVS